MDFDTKRTPGQLFLNMGALGIVLAVPTGGFFAEVRAVEQPAIVKSNARSLGGKQEQSVPSELERYETAKFSLDYPRGWQVQTPSENSVAIVSIADGVNMAIRTDIVILREDPQVAVPQRLDQIAADGLSVRRYSLVTVDGQSGLRIWYEPEAGQQALATFVGYGSQQTVVLTSQYVSAPMAESLVTQIHESFVNHSVAQAGNPE